MSILAQRVARAIDQHRSDAHRCFRCLAAQEGLNEHDVRAAALVLIVRGPLQMVRTVCGSCGRQEEMLARRG